MEDVFLRRSVSRRGSIYLRYTIAGLNDNDVQDHGFGNMQLSRVYAVASIVSLPTPAAL